MVFWYFLCHSPYKNSAGQSLPNRLIWLISVTTLVCCPSKFVRLKLNGFGCQERPRSWFYRNWYFLEHNMLRLNYLPVSFVFNVKFQRRFFSLIVNEGTAIYYLNNIAGPSTLIIRQDKTDRSLFVCICAVFSHSHKFSRYATPIYFTRIY